MALSNTIDPNWLLSSVQQKQREPKNILNKDDFLKLLLVELQNQDPLSPVDEKEMMAQLTQFTSLEQLIGIKEALDSVVVIAKENQLLKFSGFIGKQVFWERFNDELEELEKSSGKIISIEFSDYGPIFTLDNGSTISPDDIVEVRDISFEEESPLVKASRLIGYHVTAQIDGETITGIIQSVSMKNGSVSYHLADDANTIIQEKDIIAISMNANN